jgi:hypothetical protein
MSHGAILSRALSFPVMTGLVPGMMSHVGKDVVMSALCDRERLNSLLFSGAGEEL